MTHDTSWDRMVACCEAALDRRALDLVALHTGPITSVAEYFVICSGRSDTQVQAIADAIAEKLKARGDLPLAIEGRELGQWVLLDYGDVVVHVFYVPRRAFYDLERLWARAERVALPDELEALARRERTGTELG